MIAQLVNLAELRFGRFRENRLIVIFDSVTELPAVSICLFSAVLGHFSQEIIKAEVKAVEVHAFQFSDQKVIVPIGDLSDLVVQQAILLFLLFGQADDLKNLVALDMALFQSLAARFAGEYQPVLVNDDGSDVADLFHALGDVLHRMIVPAGILVVWHKVGYVDLYVSFFHSCPLLRYRYQRYG